jgi:ribose 5-phosphate isomerase B
MKIAIGADHAGFALKQHLVGTLTRLGHQVDNLGTDSTDPVDYPDICARVALAVVERRADRGVVVGGTGQGEQIAANKIPGIRAALCNDLYTARMSRAHNDANVLSIGARVVAADLADEILTLWMTTPFEGGRHLRRIEQIAELEKKNCV